MRALRLGGQGVVYLLFAVALGYLSDSPAYTYFPADRAQIKLSFSYGARPSDCRRLSAEEIAKQPPNMRKAESCSRRRQPIFVELSLDGEVLHRAWHEPTGVSGDGPARLYRRFETSPGSHTLVVAMRDSGRAEGFNHRREALIELKPRQNFVIDFRAEAGGFVFR